MSVVIKITGDKMCIFRNNIHIKGLSNIVFVLFLLFSMISCQSLDEIHERLDNLEYFANDANAAIKALQDASQKGRIVKSITSIGDNVSGGTNFAFTDNTSIRILNSKEVSDTRIPYLIVDGQGYWAISLDNGDSFTSILDKDENKIMAANLFSDSPDEINQYARIVIGADGKYLVQTYYASDPETCIIQIHTGIISEDDKVISYIIQDKKRSQAMICFKNNQDCTFHCYTTTPTGIAILNVNPINLSYGTQASVEFRINPSNAKISLDVENGDIEIDKLGEIDTRSSYVTIPEEFKLVRIDQVYDANTNEIKQGQYRAIIEDTKIFAEYDDNVALVLNTTDENGEKVQYSSSAFEIRCKTFGDLVKTGLPIVVINTPNANPIVSKNDWMAGATMTIINPDMRIDYQGTMSVKGRGNSTWSYPKKPYTLKLDKKDKVLGMNKHKRWCLLANWMDRTIMRNAVAFEISKNTGLSWTPEGRYAEVMLNGEHIGNYYVCEQIKVDENRVSIAELDTEATEGEGITGGYIFELDVNYDELFKFRSEMGNFPWQFKDPDEVNIAQFDYMVNYVNEMEHALYDADRFANRDFANYMDLESFVDWWFVNELTMNGEINHPKSCYMYKDKNGKMNAGPVWDYDWGTYRSSATSSFLGKNGLYYPFLFKDKVFIALVKERWSKFKGNLETNIPVFIDNLKEQIQKSEELNYAKWPITQEVNGDEKMNFSSAVERLKQAYLAKLRWLDQKITEM